MEGRAWMTGVGLPFLTASTFVFPFIITALVPGLILAPFAESLAIFGLSVVVASISIIVGVIAGREDAKTRIEAVLRKRNMISSPKPDDDMMVI
ncbi:MAG: hypothetical protein NUV56_00240 [Candidatus Uhrbacteria bacterium]|nr:hypothetical protein [Candidatus Uhrbacteria bacterium]